MPILAMKNKNSIRIYELICEKFIGHFPFADNATEVILPVEELRRVTETATTKSYDHIGHFKDRVLFPAIAEIEEAASWKIICEDVKRSRRVIGFRLEVWSRNGWEYIEECKRKGIIPERIEEQIPGQTDIFDFMQ